MSEGIPVRVRRARRRSTFTQDQQEFLEALGEFTDATDTDVATIAQALRDALQDPEAFALLAKAFRTGKLVGGMAGLLGQLGDVLGQLGGGPGR